MAALSATTKRILRLRDGSTLGLWRERDTGGANESQHKKMKPRGRTAVNPSKTMHLTRPLTPLHRRPRRPSGTRAKSAVSPGRERNKRANVSQDAATYNCECGYVFTAAVTTSVGCPHCGSPQAW